MLFHKSLEGGLARETKIARWLCERGNCVLPTYQIIYDQGKGPRIISPFGEMISPDMLSMGPRGVCWIEAKWKDGWTWYRKTRHWQDGIDLCHWRDYLKVAEATPWPIWILFLHEEAKGAKDSPPDILPPPAGLYGNSIASLSKRCDHESDKWGSGGMVYWNCGEALRFIAPYPFNPSVDFMSIREAAAGGARCAVRAAE